MWKKGNTLKQKNVMHSYMEKCNALMWKNIMYSCDRPLNTVKSLFSIIGLRELFYLLFTTFGAKTNSFVSPKAVS